MNFFEAHKPHIFSFFLAAVLSYIFFPFFAGFLVFWIVICILTALITPDDWIRAEPSSSQDAEAAIVFGFGYVIDGHKVLPCAANTFVVDWLVRHHPEVKIVLAQVGAYSEYERRRQQGELADDLKIIDIHERKPGVYVNYVNSMDVAEMAVEIMHTEGIQRVLVLAHHLQLKRAAWDVVRLMKKTNLEGDVLVPDLPDVPFPYDSAEWHSRRKWRYKLAELLISRPRDYWAV